MHHAIVSSDTTEIISHKNKTENFDLSVFERQLEAKTDLSLPLETEKGLLRQLSEFELGRFLLRNKGLNGYWTSYAILHGIEKENLPALEDWFLRKAPTVKATRERFYIFQKQLQKRLKNGATIASVPCGLMDDLLMLDYTNFKDVSLEGIDLDQESLNLANENAKKHGIKNVQFKKKDAWSLGVQNKYDLITSNGLNIYEQNEEKLIKLYREFYVSLKPGGVLITSFLTPPPAISKESTWKNYDIDAAIKQKAIFSDIIQAKWQAFQTEKNTRKQLAKAGFRVLEVIYDSQGMFPTIIAQKDGN